MSNHDDTHEPARRPKSGRRVAAATAPPTEKIEEFKTTLSNGTTVSVVCTTVTPAPVTPPDTDFGKIRIGEDPQKALQEMLNKMGSLASLYQAPTPPQTAWEITLTQTSMTGGTKKTVLFLGDDEASEFFSAIATMANRVNGSGLRAHGDRGR